MSSAPPLEPFPLCVKVGVAGWDYPDWGGVVYSERAPAEAKLKAVAQLFDVVEINSSFYRVPSWKTTEAWRERTADWPSFRFTAKAPQTMTHEKAEAAAIAADGAALRAGLAPLLEAGRLDGIVAQFPPWLADRGSEARDRIARVVEALAPAPVFVEIRHPSFLSEARSGAEGFLPFLERLGVGFVNVDMPPGPGSVPATTVNTSALAYVRLHGRNAAAWFDRGAGRDQKYDYRYLPEELTGWVRRMEELASRAQKVYAIANNHFRGQAPADGLELLRLLGRELPAAERIAPGLAAMLRPQPPAAVAAIVAEGSRPQPGAAR